MTERADLVVVGAGTVGGWASVFAKPAGLGRVVVVERGLAGMGASSRAAGIVRAQGGTPATVALGRWTIDFYHGQQAAYGTDSGFRELGYLILAVTDEDERAGRERVAMQQANGLGVRWLDAAAAAETAGTLSPSGHRGGSYIETDGHIDPPRNVRAYSLAMQAAGVELRERTTFTGLRTAPAPGGGSRVTAVETDRGVIETDRVLLTGGPSLRAVGEAAGVRIPAGAVRHTVAVLEPHAAFAVDARPDGLRHRRRPVLAARGGRAAVRLERPRRRAGRGPPHRLVVLRADARAAGRVRAGHARPRPPPDLGGDHRLHARPPADPRPGARRGRDRHRGRDGRLAGRARDDVGTGRRQGGRGPRRRTAGPTWWT